MAWITDAELRVEFAAAVGTDPKELSDQWDSLIPRAVQAGYADIVSILAAKGYTAAQLNQWDFRVTYNLDQSIYWLGVNGAALSDFDLDALKLRDRTKVLQTLTPTVGGSPIFPAATGPDGQGYAIAGGRLSEANYRFNMDTPM